jgi:hypothetical protein
MGPSLPRARVRPDQALDAGSPWHGLLVLIATVSLGAIIARPYMPGRLGIVVLSCALAVALLMTGSRVGVSSPDRHSVLFVEKVLFCNHMNIILASEAARHEIAVAAGGRADVMLARSLLILRQLGNLANSRLLQ